MTDFNCIDVNQAKQLLDDGATCLDIRDINSYNLGHPNRAFHIDNSNIGNLLSTLDKTSPLLIFCYHGISSQNAAQYIASQGFSHVSSVDGGFEQWQSSFPLLVELA